MGITYPTNPSTLNLQTITASIGVSGTVGLFNSISASNTTGLYSYNASTGSVLRNNPGNNPYWGPITQDMVVNLITVSLAGGSNREMGQSLPSPVVLTSNTTNETPSYARLTNNRTAEDLNVLSNFGGGNSATINSSVVYTGTLGANTDSLTYTITVKSTLSPTYSRTATTSFYWGRYMYWGTNIVAPASLAISESFVKNLDISTDSAKSLIGSIGLSSVTSYGRTFSAIPTTSYVYVAYPDALRPSPNGFRINGVDYLIANGDVVNKGTVLVSREWDNTDQILYRVLGSKSLTADANNTQTFYVI